MTVPLRLTKTNHIANLTKGRLLTAAPAPVLPALPASLTTPVGVATWGTEVTATGSQSIVIDGAVGSLVNWNYFALIGSNFGPNTAITYELFLFATDDPATATPAYTFGTTGLVDLIPLGDWVAGVDAYGGTTGQPDGSQQLIHFMPSTVSAARFRITINPDVVDPLVDPTEVFLRQAMGGEYIDVESNFRSGASLRYLSSKKLVGRPAAGSAMQAKYQTLSRQLTLSYKLLSDDNREMLLDHKLARPSAPFLVVPYPDEGTWRYPDYAFLATYGASTNMTHARKHQHTAQLVFVEA